MLRHTAIAARNSTSVSADESGPNSRTSRAMKLTVWRLRRVLFLYRYATTRCCASVLGSMQCSGEGRDPHPLYDVSRSAVTASPQPLVQREDRRQHQAHDHPPPERP